MRTAIASVLALALAILPGIAMAHAQLQRAEPKVGSAGPAPQKVQLWFSEAIEPALSKAVVKDGAGKEVDAAPGAVAADDHRRIDVAVPALPPGTYRVEWSVVSVDGHKTSGNFTFTVK